MYVRVNKAVARWSNAKIGQIPLGENRFAVVDDEDWERCRAYLWRLNFNSGGKAYVATHAIGTGGKQRIYLHRFLIDAPVGALVDHRDGDPLNNRRSNIRLATSQQNMANRTVSKRSPTGFKGVLQDKTRCQARIGGKYIGSFASPEDAARAYDQAARETYGEFACLNFPDDGEMGVRRT